VNREHWHLDRKADEDRREGDQRERVRGQAVEVSEFARRERLGDFGQTEARPAAKTPVP